MSYVNPGELTSLKLVSASVTGLRWIIMENPQPEQRPLVSNTHVHTHSLTQTHTDSHSLTLIYIHTHTHMHSHTHR